MADIATYAGEVAASLMALAVAVDRYVKPAIAKRNGKTVPPPAPHEQCADVPRLYDKVNENSIGLAQCQTEIGGLTKTCERIEVRITEDGRETRDKIDEMNQRVWKALKRE